MHDYPDGSEKDIVSYRQYYNTPFLTTKNISFLDIWNNFSRNDLRLHIHSMIKQYVIVLY